MTDNISEDDWQKANRAIEQDRMINLEYAKGINTRDGEIDYTKSNATYIHKTYIDDYSSTKRLVIVITDKAKHLSMSDLVDVISTEQARVGFLLSHFTPESDYIPITGMNTLLGGKENFTSYNDWQPRATVLDKLGKVIAKTDSKIRTRISLTDLII